ncbi:MAG TPA: S8 family peptidase [Bacteroidales bacterium]|nr:S8 family peptidase [Bacteroidales bacterium]
MKRFLLVLALFGLGFTLFAQNPTCYRVYLNNKNNSTFSVDNPEAFLSPRAIAKRAQYNIPITTQDLPVNQSYLNQILAFDPTIQILTTSKWLNTAVIYCPNNAHIPGIQNLACVQYIVPVANYNLNSPRNGMPELTGAPDKFDLSRSNSLNYGDSYDQIKVHRGDSLHNRGFRGEGMLICILDAGWEGFDTLSHFQSLYTNGQIWGTRDLIPGVNNVYFGHGHGTSVTSIIASNIPDALVGTAPNANFFFIRSENPWSEQLIEEDFWVAGAELADSLGADVINSSLGYTEFADFPEGNMTPQDNDGITGVSSQAATIAGEKGIVVVISAGNERDSNWGYIGRPADAIDVISVGAMSKDSVIAPFSSFGPSADGRVKPDVTSVGWDTWVSTTYGAILQGNGTSYSGPVIAGLAACLWQALPHLNAVELMQEIREYGHIYNTPDHDFGYGIPDFFQAFLDNSTSIASYNQEKSICTFPNPASDEITFQSLQGNIIDIQIFDVTGKKILSYAVSNQEQISITVSTLKAGLYFAHITTQQNRSTIKFVKR